MEPPLIDRVRAATSVLYGPGAARATRATRREAESMLLGLRKMEGPAAMDVCVQLLSVPNDPSAIFAAQTVAELCRRKEPESGWPDAVLQLHRLEQRRWQRRRRARRRRRRWRRARRR